MKSSNDRPAIDHNYAGRARGNLIDGTTAIVTLPAIVQLIARSVITLSEDF